MNNRQTNYFKDEDLTSVQKLEQALFRVQPPQYIIDDVAKEHRIAVTAELIDKIKNNNNLTTKEKIKYLDTAIVHSGFSIQKLGAIKREVNFLLSGKTSKLNYAPFFKSTSQNMLVICKKDLVAKEEINKNHNLRKK